MERHVGPDTSFINIGSIWGRDTGLLPVPWGGRSSARRDGAHPTIPPATEGRWISLSSDCRENQGDCGYLSPFSVQSQQSQKLICMCIFIYTYMHTPTNSPTSFTLSYNFIWHGRGQQNMTEVPLKTHVCFALDKNLLECVWAELISHTSQILWGMIESTFIDMDLYR